MTSIGRNLDKVLVTERELWEKDPPHELFRELRQHCPVHWTSRITEFPEEDGFWSVTTADDVHAVSRDWQTYSSERGGVTAATAGFPIELLRAMFIGMDPPKHDRIKALFQAGFTPKRIAAHEPEIRAIVIDVLDRLEGRDECDLVNDVAQPVVSRVIGSFMGIPPEDDAVWANLMNSTLGAGDPDLNPAGIPGVIEKDIPEIFERCRMMIADRREHPTDDLTSVLVHAEIDGQKLEEAARSAEHDGVSVAMRGMVVDIGQQQDAPVGELIGVALAIVLLTALFRSKAAMGATLLGALLTLSPLIWYASYVAAATPGGLSALEDQQLAGLVMWVPGGLVYVGAALAICAGLLRDDGAPALRRRARVPGIVTWRA